MRFLARTGILILQLGVFFVLMVLISLATTWFTAERYEAGATPSRLFPVIALPPDGGDPPRYELLRWPGLERKDPPPPPRRLRLPQARAAFEVPVVGGYAPDVSFTAREEADGRQRVEVRVTEDDYVIYAVYLTDGKTVVPQSFRLWGPSSALLAVFPAFVLSLVFGRLLRRRFGGAQKPASA